MHNNTLHNTGTNKKRSMSRIPGSNSERNTMRRVCANKVRLALLKRGLSYAEVARRLGVSNRSTIARVVYGHYILPEVRDGIAELLGVPTERLWPTDRAA